MSKRSHRHFKRTSPDMGWIVGTTSFSEFTSDGNFCRAIQLFDFADIDPEALTGRIEADKSDWYFKRMILDIYQIANLPGTDVIDMARLTQHALGVMGNQDASDISGAGHTIIGPEVYNRWARLFRTMTMPAYHPGGLPMATSDGYPDGGIATVPSSDLSHSPSGFFPLTNFWGEAALHVDVPISNAGMRNNQGCYWLIGDAPAPSAMEWKNGDTLYGTCTYRFLMQKRVG